MTASGSKRPYLQRIDNDFHPPCARLCATPPGRYRRTMMQIRAGFEMVYDCPQPTPMIFNLNVHFTRVSDLVGRDDLVVDPPVPMAAYRDSFGNWCTRIVAPTGRTRVPPMRSKRDSGAPDVIVAHAHNFPCPTCPRKHCCSCWEAATAKPTGFQIRRGICSGRHPRDGAAFRRSATTSTGISPSVRACAHDAHRAGSLSRQDRRLPRLCIAVAFCRCMNIPARY